MKKNKKVLRITLIVLGIILVIGAIVAITAYRVLTSMSEKVTSGEISGKVVEVIDKPNQAEDGKYQIVVEENLSGWGDNLYRTIDATGYLNTPLTPESQGETCLDIPKVKVGDQVTFRLPIAEEDLSTFVTCYKKGLEDFYFKVK